MSCVATPAPVSREQTILDHLPQVKFIAARFHRRCPPEVLLEDLVSAGVIGLLDGYSRFDARRDFQFKTFAEHRIRGAIIDYLRRLDPLPRDVRRFQKQRDVAISRLSQRHGCTASEQEIAEEMGVTACRYRKLAAIAQTTTISIDERCAGERPVGDIPDPASLSNGEYALLTPAVKAAVDELPARERAVIVALGNGDSHRAIADRLHVSEGRVSQIKNGAIRHLRAALGVRTPAP